MSLDFSQIEAVIMDMDGVLWRGDMALPHMPAFIHFVRVLGHPLMLATNNSSRHPSQFVEKLARMGVDSVPESAIITSGTATSDYLRQHYGDNPRVHLIGEDGLRRVLTEGGVVIDDGDDTSASALSAVVVGLDRNFHYEQARRTMALIMDGLPFIATNPDTSFPMPDGLAPGAGSIARMLAVASEVEPTFIGKPAPAMFEIAMKRMGSHTRNTLMIGDRLNTDIEGAVALGIPTALVMTGITTSQALEQATTRPDGVYQDLGDLMASWQMALG